MPVRVFAADVDGDGDIDVLSASTIDDKIAWYENLPNQPEVDVLGNGVSIFDGDTTPSLADHTNFGATLTIGSTVSRSFTIANIGGRSLNLTGMPRVVISGVHASDFTRHRPAEFARRTRYRHDDFRRGL